MYGTNLFKKLLKVPAKTMHQNFAVIFSGVSYGKIVLLYSFLASWGQNPSGLPPPEFGQT